MALFKKRKRTLLTPDNSELVKKATLCVCRYINNAVGQEIVASEDKVIIGILTDLVNNTTKGVK